MATTEVATNGTAPLAEAEPNPALPTDILTKYKAAADIVARAVQSVIKHAVEDAKILSLCQEGDRLIEEGCASVYNKDKKKPTPKGIAFPCTISVNNVVCHFSPLPNDPSASQTLHNGDVVKILLGAHIDGFPCISGETIIVGATSSSPTTGTRADLLAATYHAAEAALRSVKPGGRNWEIVDVVNDVLKEYQGTVKGLEGMVSHQHEQNVIAGKKTISLFNSSHRDKDSTFTFEEGEVYGLDVILTTGEETKARSLGDRTTIFQKTAAGTYQLKMKTSRSTYGEVVKKAGSFPFTLRTFEDEQKARMGVKECVQHGMLKEFDITTTVDTKDMTAQAFVTFVVMKNGASRITPPQTFYTGPNSDRVKSEIKIQDAELAALLARSLKAGKKRSKKEQSELANDA